MLKKSVRMQMSYLTRSKSAIFILFALLAAIGINFLNNLGENSEVMYITQMFSFEKVLSLSSWTGVGYYMMEYYPLLIVIPTGCAYIIDRNCGVNTYIQSRVGKRNYWYGKLISVFVLTFLIFTLPYLTEIILDVLCFDMSSKGDPSRSAYWMSIESENIYFLSQILLHNRIIYSLIMTVLFGLASAVLATFNFAVTTLPMFKIKIFAYFPIYVLFFVISMLEKIVNLNFTMDYYFILRMFEITTAKNYIAYVVFLMALLAISVGLIERKIKKEDVL